MRSSIAANMPGDVAPDDGIARIEFERAWQAALAGADLVAVHFPRDYGGRDLGWTETFIVQEELALAHAPEIVNRVAINLVGPTLLEHGTEEQRRRYLRSAITAEDIWCQLFSEPEAGSDLGSMRTRAEQVDGGWRVTGQKVWASNAPYRATACSWRAPPRETAAGPRSVTSSSTWTNRASRYGRCGR